MTIRFMLLMLAVLFTTQTSWSMPATVISDGKFLFEDRIGKSAEAPATPLRDLLLTSRVYTGMTMSKEVLEGTFGYDYYILQFSFRGFWKNVQAELKFYIQTLTQEHMERIAAAIEKNYATRGFPECMMNEPFYTDQNLAFNYSYDPDFTTIYIPVKLKDVPDNFPGAPLSRRPWTQCVLTEDLYPTDTR